MFSSLTLKNFKAYRDSGPVPLRPLTVIVGSNNSGKSTLLQGLLILKQTIEDRSTTTPLVTSGPLINAGSFNDILRGGQRALQKTLSISLSLSDDYVRRVAVKTVPSSSDLDLSFALDQRANRINLTHARVANRNKTLLDVSRRGSTLRAKGLPQFIARQTEVHPYHFLPRLHPAGKMPPARYVERVFDEIQTSEWQTRLWSHAFEETNFVSPLRLPIPHYSLLGEIPTSQLGVGGENVLRVLRSTQKVRDSRTLLDLVNLWMTQRFEMLKELRFEKLDPEGNVQRLVGDERQGLKGINIADMGEGISQLLPIVASVLTVRNNSCLLVEQPEIHLHPAAQADLGDLFVENLGREQRRQFIVETHSEHLLLRVRLRVAEGRIDPKQVAVLYVERGRLQPTVRLLELNGEGSFLDWPKGFFEEGYREALSLAEATAKRRRTSRRLAAKSSDSSEATLGNRV